MKKLLYVFDDINYLSGARKVTEYQIKLLSNKYDISVFSLTWPSPEIEYVFNNIKFIDAKIWDKTKVLGLSFCEVLKSQSIPIYQKIIRVVYAISMRLHIENLFIYNYIFSYIKDSFNEFDIICVVSESSKLRSVVSRLKGPKKVQWIHTDYLQWSNFSNWTRSITKNDGIIFENFDYIVTLSEENKLGFLKKHPSAREKTIVIPNLIPVEEIVKKSKERLNIKLDKNITNIVTVGRIDKEKSFERILKICKNLKSDGFSFHWYIVGDGPLFKMIEGIIRKENLTDDVFMLGYLDNPYPLIKQCDIFALLSEYEGLPVTIDEAIILGTKVLATNVGGISEQLKNVKQGIIVENDEMGIYNLLKTQLNINIIQQESENEIEKYITKNSIILNKIVECFEA